MIDKEAWAEEAYAALRAYARYMHRLGLSARTIEHFRAASIHVAQMDMPADLRWWGPVVQRALREKIIIRKGWGTAKSSNRSPKRRYIGSKWA